MVEAIGQVDPWRFNCRVTSMLSACRTRFGIVTCALLVTVTADICASAEQYRLRTGPPPREWHCGGHGAWHTRVRTAYPAGRNSPRPK